MVGIIIQARMGSTRMPGKTMTLIQGKPLLFYCFSRASLSKYAEKVIIATTIEPSDDVIEKWCHENGVLCFRGSENDVLDRYYNAASLFGLDVIVRLTADNPFVDPKIVDMLITSLFCFDKEYVTMRLKTNTWPYGLDAEVFTYKALKENWEKSHELYHREHVTTYIKDNPTQFRILEIPLDQSLAHIRLTVDYPKDFSDASYLLKILLSRFGLSFSWNDVLSIVQPN